MKKWFLLFALIFLGSVGGAAVTLWLMPRTSVAWTGESAPIRLTGFPEHIMEHPNFVAASAMATPAVVHIKTKQSGMAGAGGVAASGAGICRLGRDGLFRGALADRIRPDQHLHSVCVVSDRAGVGVVVLCWVIYPQRIV